MAWRRVTTLAAAATLAVVGAPAASAGAPGSYFLSLCQFSHRAADDPIVLPRAPGFSHDHSFVGNLTTNAFSTEASLRKAGTSCTPQADTSAYWAPTLYADGRPVAPVKAAIYSRRLTTAPVRPFPPGLRMVAGNAHAYRPQSSAVTYWDCSLLKTTFYGPNGGGSGAVTAVASSTVPTCPQKAEVQLHVNFPECWDGKRLDSFDHRSHMAYARAGQCPAGHPVAAPAPPSWFSASRIRCSICQRSPADSPRSIASSSACAASSCARAAALSICDASTAWSTSAIARSFRTWKKPGPVAYTITSAPPPGWMRVEPALSVAISGAWRASTPISPICPGTTIISISPS